MRLEWRLLMMTHNLTKVHRHQLAAVGPETAPQRHTAAHRGHITNGATTAPADHHRPQGLSDSLDEAGEPDAPSRSRLLPKR